MVDSVYSGTVGSMFWVDYVLGQLQNMYKVKDSPLRISNVWTIPSSGLYEE